MVVILTYAQRMKRIAHLRKPRRDLPSQCVIYAQFLDSFGYSHPIQQFRCTREKLITQEPHHAWTAGRLDPLNTSKTAAPRLALFRRSSSIGERQHLEIVADMGTIGYESGMTSPRSHMPDACPASQLRHRRVHAQDASSYLSLDPLDILGMHSGPQNRWHMPRAVLRNV
ncbi:hypothetical protein GY45DRAFT_463050 [Cubamyces sp. BRFM 1775]|nr:hypothetical protein GY45DRAFT_463050 [Cubamyces sp. BRFM 1775]